MNTYARLPVSFVRGEGAYLWDENDQQYLDALSGIAVCSLGHARREVADAICEQANTLVHTSNIYNIPNQEALGDKLCELSGMEKVFFSNSGAEANEAAIKIARLYGRKKDIAVPEVIVMNSSFHGRTMATLSATGNRKVQAGFSPLVQGFIRVDYNDIEAIKNIAETNNNVVAILVEPVQGEGGVHVPDDNYLTTLRDICDQQDWLLMLDEIQTGVGRTGEWFAFQHEDIKPDVMTLAKALGNGVPIGACLTAGKATDVLQPGTHGSTYGGNPLACRAGSAVLEVMEKENLPQRAKELGQLMLTAFMRKLVDNKSVKDIRGKGMMIGIELDRDCGELVTAAMEKQLLINVTAGNTIRLLPPLTITEEQADTIVNTVVALVQAFTSKK
jgi:acetylornithine aminotransferase